MTILDIGELSPAIGAAKLREPITLSGDFTLHLDYSQDFTQGEFLYALGYDGTPAACLSCNAGEIWMTTAAGGAGITLSGVGSGRHTLRIRRVGSDWFIVFDGLPEQAMEPASDPAASFTFDKVNAGQDQPHSDPGSVIHSLRIETN